MAVGYEPELVEAGHRAGLEALGRDERAGARRDHGALPRALRADVLGAGDARGDRVPGARPRAARALRHRGHRRGARPLPRGGARSVGAGAGARRRRRTRCSSRCADAASSSGSSRTRSTRAGCSTATSSRSGSRSGSTTRVFSSEVGKRKPHPEIFERALDALEVAPEEALFVGDRLYEDVRGAGEVGMTTVQAVWFRADEHPDGAEPDHQAFTQMDVLNVADRLLAAACQAFSDRLVKTCGEGRPCRKCPTMRRIRGRSAGAPSPSTGRGRVSPLRSPLRQGRLPVGVRRARLPVPLLVRRAGPDLRRLHAEGLRRRDRSRADARGGGARRVSARCGRTGSRCRCAGSRSRACYEGREDELGCVNPEFDELPLGEPSFRVFAQVQPSA